MKPNKQSTNVKSTENKSKKALTKKPAPAKIKRNVKESSNKTSKSSSNRTVKAKSTKSHSKATLITKEIYDKYTRSPMLSHYEIGVKSTEAGDVTLRGKLSTDARYSEAIKLAQSVSAVKNVNSDALIVTPSDQPISDTWITTKVMARLFIEGLSWGVRVETKNGVVYLSGTTEKSKDNDIEKLIKEIDGVKSAENNLESA